MKELKRVRNFFVGFSVLSLILGICIVAWPGMSAMTLCFLTGALLIIVGLVRIVCYFTRGSVGMPLFSSLALGIFSLLLGALLVSRPGSALVLLPYVAGFTMLMNGASEIQAAMDVRRSGAGGWWAVLLMAILTMACGLLLILNPFSGALTLMVLLGISLIVDSIVNIITTLFITSYVKKNLPIEVDYEIK